MLTIVLVSLAHGPFRAATVELRVVDELDEPIVEARVGLNLIEAGSPYYYAKTAVTDGAGRVMFDGVKPGRYMARLQQARGRFVTLQDHPLTQPPTITVEDQLDNVRTEVRFHRGVPVIFRVSVDGDRLPGAELRLRDLDRGYSTSVRMGRVESEARLVPGRWTAEVDPVPGYLLTDVVVNRNELPGHVAEFDPAPGDLAWYVTFEFSAPASIWGQVYYEGEEFGVDVVARLQEAGTWLPKAMERGGSLYEQVNANPAYPKWDYEMVVPDGRWIVTVEDDDLLSSDPPSVELSLQPGEDRRVDFTVRGDPSGGSRGMTVHVIDPAGRRIGGAIVEVWPEDPDARGDEPIERERTPPWGQAYLRGLANESYLFAAGCEGFVEAGVVGTPPGDEEQRSNRITVRLKRGATVHTIARNQDRPVPDVAVELTRLDEYESLLTAEEIRAWIDRPFGTTDETGHLWLRGVYPGRYRLTGTLEEDDASWSFVEFRDPDDRTWSRTLEREYGADEIDEIEVRLSPAGSIRGRLHCADGSELPPEADILVLPGDVPRTGSTESDWRADTILESDKHVLEDSRRDRFTIGPLEVGAYQVLVRPEGHDRWTWAVGTESIEEAAIVAVEAGDPTDLGALSIDCGPAVVIYPQPAGELELPDLAKSQRFDPAAELTGHLVVDGREREVGRVRTSSEPARFQFRDLPEGEARLIATVRNPLFLPEPELNIDIEATLERGRNIDRRPPVRIGGAIELSLGEPLAGTVTAARAVPSAPLDAATEPPIREVRAGMVLLPSLEPGVYRVEICSDAACSRVEAVWEEVVVQAGQIVFP